MLIAILTSLLILVVVFGYAFAFKKFILRENVSIENIDFFYGLLIILFLSLLFNFFVPLSKLNLLVCIIGFLFFLFGFLNKKININFLKYIFIIFTFTFLSFYNGNNVDSPMYHLQTIKWISSNKATFGLANIEIRLGMNASWHSIISLLDLNFQKFSVKFYFNSIILSVFIYEVLSTFNKNSKSSILIWFFALYLLTFSLVHPFNNGIILNHLGNPERDIFSMISYFFVFYLLLKLYEANFNKNNFKNLLFICIFLCITSRISNLGLILIPLFLLIVYKKIQIINLSNLIIVFTGTLWLLRNFVLSGCFVFPVNFTCMNTNWSVNLNEMNYMVNEAMGITRDAPFKTRHLDFDYTLYSFDWFMPWFKNYFLATSFIQLGLFILFIAFAMIFFSKRKTSKNDKKFYFLCMLPLIFNFFIWFKAPEVRYAWASFIIFPSLLLLLAIFKNELILKFIKSNSILIKNSIYVIMILLIVKNVDHFKYADLLKFDKKKFDYSKIKKIGNFDGFDFYKSENWQCADFEKICINKQKNKYRVKVINNYIFFLKN